MSETQSTNTPASSETAFLNRKWKLIRFFFAEHAFESKLEGILGAAAGHEGNSLPSGDRHYQLLSNEADSLCTEFADRWGLDVDLLRARIPGLAKFTANVCLNAWREPARSSPKLQLLIILSTQGWELHSLSRISSHRALFLN